MTFEISDAEAEDEKAQQDDLIPENAATSPVAYSQKSVKSGRTEAKRSITPPDGLISSLGLSSFLRCPCVRVCMCLMTHSSPFNATQCSTDLGL